MSDCGTRAGYLRHTRRHTAICDPCRAANTAYSARHDAELREERARQRRTSSPRPDVATPTPWPLEVLDAGPACTRDDAYAYTANVQTPSMVAELKRICARCPARIACLEYALQYPQVGVWGGTTEEERDAMMRERTA